MNISCPITTTKEWQQLVEYAGSQERAERLYFAYTQKTGKNEVPPMSYIENLSKSSVEQKEDITKHQLYPLIFKNIKEQERLQKIIATKQSDLKTSKNKIKSSKEIQSLKDRVKELEEENYDIKRKKGLEEVAKYAEADLNRVRSIFDKYARGEVELDEITNAVKIITMWQKAGDFSQGEHLFLTAEELADVGSLDNEVFNAILDNFKKWRGEADILSIKYKKIALDIVKNDLQEMFGENLELEVNKTMKDVGFLFENTVDISEIDHQVCKLMSQHIRKADWDAQKDVKADFEKTAELIDKLRKANQLDKFVSLLQQKQSNTDNRLTSHITSRFTQKWHNKEQSIINRLKQSLAASYEIKDTTKKRQAQQKAYKQFQKSINAISTTIDVRKLFFDHPLFKEYKKEVNSSFEDINVDFTENDRLNYIKELKDILGEDGYKHYYEQVKRKINTYSIDEQGAQEYYESIFGDDMAGITSKMEEWRLKYSPFWNSHYAEHGHPIKKIGNTWTSSSNTYISTIAKKYDKNGKDNGFYDDNFKKITANPLMNEVYYYITEVLQEYSQFLPANEIKFWHKNTFPTIEKSILESFGRDGMLSGLHSTFDALRESTKTEVYSKEIPTDINDKELQIGINTNSNSIVFDYITRKSIAYKQAHPEATNEELDYQKDEWRKDKENELASKKSWDIEKVLKAFMYQTAMFKHKTKIEDAMKIYRTYIDEIVEQQTHVNDNPNSNVSRKLNAKTEDIHKIKEQIDYQMNAFFGYNIKKQEKNEKKEQRKRKYTKEEEKTRQELETSLAKLAEDFNNRIITEEVYAKDYNILTNQLKTLGKVWSWKGFFDDILKYIQLKQIGWNISSIFANRGFGKIANIIEAAGGQRFNQKERIQATLLMQSSILKNYSFDKIQTQAAKKIKNSMTFFDVLKESKNEIFEQKRYNGLKMFKWLAPFNGQSRGEYLNQGEVMIAMLKHNKCLVDGKEMDLWEAQQEGGGYADNVKPPANSGFKTFDNYIFNIKSKIDEAIRTLHGNYEGKTATIKAKETTFGQAISQFRTWAFMTFYDRFGRPDETINDIVGFQKKGRYLSYGTLFQSFGAAKATVLICQNLLRKLAFSNTKFDELVGDKFTETDAANLRKNLQELVLYMIITGLGLLARSMIIDDDDDEADALPLYLATFWINQMGRLKTDILFYTNPMEFEKLQQNTIPMFNLVTDSSKLLTHGGKLLLGAVSDDYDYSDTYQGGKDAGRSKSLRYINRMFPLTAQVENFKSVIKKVR